MAVATLLPFEDFYKSAQALSPEDLKESGNYAYKILTDLVPTPKMWDGFKVGLAVYGIYLSAESGMRLRPVPKARALFEQIRLDYVMPRPVTKRAVPMPGWLGGEIHNKHRAMLLKRNPEWYKERLGG